MMVIGVSPVEAHDKTERFELRLDPVTRRLLRAMGGWRGASRLIRDLVLAEALRRGLLGAEDGEYWNRVRSEDAWE